MYQRQLSKEGLQNVVNSESKGGAALMSSEDLRDLFTLRGTTLSDTYDSMCCSDTEEDSQKENEQPEVGCEIKQQVPPPPISGLFHPSSRLRIILYDCPPPPSPPIPGSFEHEALVS